MSDPVGNSKMVARHCPVCAQGAAVEYLRKQDLRLQRCAECSMVYVSPVPAQFASGSYYDTEAGSYYLSPAKLQSDYADVRFERELQIFRQHCAAGRVLDVGCSSGAFLYQLRKRFPGQYDILGTDASGPALDYAEKQGIPIVRGDFFSEDFAGQKFDAVTFWAVLEHVVNPAAFLDHASTVLHERGLCIVLVPNLNSLATRLLGARYRYIYPQHLNYFSRRTLAALVRKQFEIVEVRTTHLNPVVIWQDWRQRGAEVSNEARAALLQKTTAYKQKALFRPIKAAYQLVETALGALGLADNLVMVLRKRGTAQPNLIFGTPATRAAEPPKP